jgi:ADP-heptose:LPS heptosyltransferase
MLTEGCADKLIPTDKGINFPKSETSTITLCLRDRELAEHRNWYFEYWNELTRILCDMNYNVVTIGLVKNKTFKPDKRVKNFVNSTSINDCINILCNSDLAVGGSSGTMHLASRCGTDHIVWGSKVSEEILNQSNWFGAYCGIIKEGWKPDVDVVVKYIVDYFQNRRSK